MKPGSSKELSDTKNRSSAVALNSGTWFSAIRIRQWSKNLLIFVPLLTSHSLTQPRALISALIAFLCFSLCASANYLLNDVLDFETDKTNDLKNKRPIAAGLMSVKQAMISSLILLGLGLTTAFVFLNTSFLIALSAYLLLAVLYSLRLKLMLVVDVMVLASLFTLRIAAGSAVIEVSLSFWLLCFSMFLFLSLALVKRISELIHRGKTSEGLAVNAIGRRYFTSDIPVLRGLGVASGLIAILIFALYINSDDVVVLYHRPQILWLVVPVLGYWIMRVWILTARGEMEADPIDFAIFDRNSWLAAILIIVVFLLATVL
jgi:4-hydroxybenzoate polyprenyltransferase